MAKRKTKKTKIFKNKFVLWLFLFFVGILVVGSAFVAGYIVAKNTIKPKVVVKKDTKAQKALAELQKLVDENLQKQQNEINHKKVVKKTKKLVISSNNAISSEALDYSQNSYQVTNQTKKEPVIHTNKPKLVIIMDDMSFGFQVKSLKNLHMVITPSFFPPTYNHPNTAKYAKEFKHYMVHFPMQATNPNFHEEPYTLHIDSSSKFIESRVKFIKKNFPNLKFVNNHTGSKFTSNLASMQKLYKALNKYDIIFIDSVTTSKSKAPIVAKENHKILLQRDVFLDNFPTVTYIKNQLKKAVKKAKKNGYAIAICHPQKATFEALRKSKNILKGVELIYIGQMYEFAKKHHISRL
jgi:polysaccharide deacetylase 2 family uncharacterized protein YibQ